MNLRGALALSRASAFLPSHLHPLTSHSNHFLWMCSSGLPPGAGDGNAWVWVLGSPSLRYILFLSRTVSSFWKSGEKRALLLPTGICPSRPWKSWVSVLQLPVSVPGTDITTVAKRPLASLVSLFSLSPLHLSQHSPSIVSSLISSLYSPIPYL